MSQAFSDNVVWVTGAAQGIGAAIARAFRAQGAHVIGIDRTFAEGAGHIDVAVVLDVTDAEAVARQSAQLLLSEGLDILVNAAGVLRTGTLEQLSEDDWQACIDTNAGGVYRMFHNTMGHFKAQRSGAIVTVGSNAAHAPRIGMSAYGASKAALRSLCLSAGLELAPYGVRCNLVSPGSTDTAMQRSLWHGPESEQQTIRGFPDDFKLGIPLGKIAQPQDIADAVLYLASPHAGHVTLQDIVIDGGATLGA
ncbi:2,3-dihydro-2,3-dihydroxybenzoate dehydrogenase [Zymobacter palmae]|uniref:2,3-dihydro-2,3-dihydroxybenzoate dehydrogenase n=1 Tax=Zymobacter palmae TaxID=33074 RepID=A0A348HEP4_9GAMM|nr:2,3-dihydro-2,3-dihydroxybenzoate dehydrogenase [Zymobacter palmae]BBG30096.1 putative 2,3-dihydro-2,3-dihydroxybenzoate dehydrogenase PhbA [Zymobacter palmae]